MKAVMAKNHPGGTVLNLRPSPKKDSTMASPAQPGQHYRFGVFTADLHSGELRKQGIRIKLQERPFQLLLALLERPGQVITREELRQRLWPDGTFDDFDHSISSAINKLRTVHN